MNKHIAYVEVGNLKIAEAKKFMEEQAKILKEFFAPEPVIVIPMRGGQKSVEVETRY